MEPFHRMESHTLVLSRLHETSDLLRRIARLQQLSKKLQTCQDQVKAAALLNEIGNISFVILSKFYKPQLRHLDLSNMFHMTCHRSIV